MNNKVKLDRKISFKCGVALNEINDAIFSNCGDLNKRELRIYMEEIRTATNKIFKSYKKILKQNG